MCKLQRACREKNPGDVRFQACALAPLADLRLCAPALRLVVLCVCVPCCGCPLLSLVHSSTARTCWWVKRAPSAASSASTPQAVAAATRQQHGDTAAAPAAAAVAAAGTLLQASLRELARVVCTWRRRARKDMVVGRMALVAAAVAGRGKRAGGRRFPPKSRPGIQSVPHAELMVLACV